MSEIVIATWPQYTGHNFFGLQYDRQLSDCDSYGLRLRVLDKAGKQDVSIRSGLGMYVWFDKTQVLVEPRIQDIYSMNLYELEKIIKHMRKLSRHATGFKSQEPAQTLIKAFSDMGIKRTIEYQHLKPETYGSATDAAFKFAELIAKVRADFR